MKTLKSNKINLFILFAICFFQVSYAQTYNYEPYRRQVNPTKNVIVLIPDGTSMSVVSAARWYKIYNNLGEGLNVDSHLCGTVKTFSSNAPIGDSAPTTSCYMTGMPQQTGNVAIYPPADPDNDLVAVDPDMAYQPLATLLEASKIQQNKSVGLVTICEFPHATPADCSAHYYSRGDYKKIAPQMAYQNLDVMFGGGNKFISDDMKQHFGQQNIQYIKDDISTFRQLETGKAWALFANEWLSYDLDRNPETTPSLKEMTQKALDLLSQNDNGFFLMVEGSRIDWAAHGNNAIACITDYLAFDDAVGAAMEFAKKDGNTTVVVLPDHGNSGFSIGRYDLPSYDRATIHQLFGNCSKYKRTSDAIAPMLLNAQPNDFSSIMLEYTGIELSEKELHELWGAKDYKPENFDKPKEMNNSMHTLVNNLMNAKTYFGFTTGGHTGEEVFLAAYHPQGHLPIGMNTNREINHYLSDALGLETKLPEFTQQIFAKHADVFAGYKYEIDKSNADFPVLIIKKGRNRLEIPAFKSVVYLNKKPVNISSVVVYIDKTDTFYLPQELATML